MHKAIQLKVTLWIEGEDEPANDFAKLATQHVRDVLVGGQGQKRNLKVTIKDIHEDEADSDDEYKPGSNKSASKP